MNKKGEITFEELLKTIVSLGVVLLLVGAGIKLWKATHPEQFTTERKDLKRIVSEIKDLKINDDLTIPLFTTKMYVVRVLKPNDADRKVTVECTKEFCVCFLNGPTAICEPFDLDKKEFGKRSSGDSIKCDVFLIDHYKDAPSTKNFRITRGQETCLIDVYADAYVQKEPVSVSTSSQEPNIAASEMGVNNEQ